MRLLILSFILLSTTSSALARPADPVRVHATNEQRAPEGSYLVLDRLQASVDEDAVVIDIAVEARSWSWAQQQAVTPLVFTELALDNGRTQIVPSQLDKREAKLRLVPERGARPKTIDVWIGNAGRARVEPLRWFQLAGMSFERVRLAFAPPLVALMIGDTRAAPPASPPRDARPAPNWAADPETIAACADAVRDQSACMTAVHDMRKQPAPLIEACTNAFPSRAMAQTCIESAAKASFDGAELVSSCAFHLMASQDGALECINIASHAAGDPTRTIEACAQSGRKTQTLACLRTAYP